MALAELTVEKQIIGNREWCAFPELGIPAVKARVDSGAKTSSLHAFDIEPFERGGEPWVRFTAHPVQDDDEASTVVCEQPLVAKRGVKSSSGDVEKRYVIRTVLTLGEQSWPVELNLTNRDSMGYRMLLGREAMMGRVLIDPEKSCCMGDFSTAELQQLYAG